MKPVITERCLPATAIFGPGNVRSCDWLLQCAFYLSMWDRKHIDVLHVVFQQMALFTFSPETKSTEADVQEMDTTGILVTCDTSRLHMCNTAYVL